MREIKFRAWEKYEPDYAEETGRAGEMHYTADYGKDDKLYEKRCVVISGFYHDSGWSWEDFEIMQFTGLKDKNGKEIYQGDLLKVKADKEGYGQCSYGGIVEVTSETCGYSLKPIKPTFQEMEERGEPWDSSSMWHICEEGSDGKGTTEVIGNIYKNPELLK